MPYVRRFYYLPRDIGPRETDVLDPSEGTLNFDGPLDHQSNQDGCQTESGNWKSFQDLPDEERKKQLRFKKILGTLNRVTPKMLQKLINHIGPESMDISEVKMLAETIFSKAQLDNIYVNLYARLCEEVMTSVPTELLQCFKDVLMRLFHARITLILNLTDDAVSDINEDKQLLFKRKLMTMMRFVGEMSSISVPLFDRHFLWELIEKLIDKGEAVHLEAIYFLLFTITLRSSDNAWPENLWLSVAKLARGIGPRGESVSSRTRFMFLSLVEARLGVLPLDQLPNQTSPSTSDTESNQQMPDFKGF